MDKAKHHKIRRQENFSMQTFAVAAWTVTKSKIFIIFQKHRKAPYAKFQVILHYQKMDN